MEREIEAAKYFVKCPCCERALQTRELRETVGEALFSKLVKRIAEGERRHMAAEDMAAIAQAGLSIKLCPQCSTMIEKNDGCSSMNCYLCGPLCARPACALASWYAHALHAHALRAVPPSPRSLFRRTRLFPSFLLGIAKTKKRPDARLGVRDAQARAFTSPCTRIWCLGARPTLHFLSPRVTAGHHFEWGSAKRPKQLTKKQAPKKKAPPLVISHPPL